MSLTPEAFVGICEDFMNEYSSAFSSASTLAKETHAGWVFHRHPNWAQHCYLSRTTMVREHNPLAQGTILSEVDLDQDFESYPEIETDSFADIVSMPSTIQQTNYITHQYIVYSATYQVPVFYFILSTSDGTVLTLNEIMKTKFFKPGVLPAGTTSDTSFEPSPLPLSSGESASTFPLLSQGDHPVTGMTCWYFHPCETSRAMAELLQSQSSIGSSTQTSEPSRIWLEIWLALIGTIVELRP